MSSDGEFLFKPEPAWARDWIGMPDFGQTDLMPRYTVEVFFRTPADRARFQTVISQKFGDAT